MGRVARVPSTHKTFVKVVLCLHKNILECWEYKLPAIRTWLLEEAAHQTAREHRTSGAWPTCAMVPRGKNLNNRCNWEAQFLSPLQAILWMCVFYCCGCCHYWMFLCDLVLFRGGGRVPIRMCARQSRMPLGRELRLLSVSCLHRRGFISASADHNGLLR